MEILGEASAAAVSGTLVATPAKLNCRLPAMVVPAEAARGVTVTRTEQGLPGVSAPTQVELAMLNSAASVLMSTPGR